MKELAVIISEAKVAGSSAVELESKFRPIYDQIKQWEHKAKKLVVTSEYQVKEMEEAGKARRAVVKVRTSADKTRKELKAEALAYGNAVQGVYNEITSMLKPIEDHLMVQEKFAENAREQKRLQLEKERTDILGPLASFLPPGTIITALSEERFQSAIKYCKNASKEADEEAARLELEKALQNKAVARQIKIAPYRLFVLGDPNYASLTEGEFEQMFEDAKSACEAKFAAASTTTAPAPEPAVPRYGGSSHASVNTDRGEAASFYQFLTELTGIDLPVGTSDHGKRLSANCGKLIKKIVQYVGENKKGLQS